MKKASSSPRSSTPKSAANLAAGPSRPRAPRKKPAVSAAPAPAYVPTDTDIARRAYQIFLARNGEPGDALADWLQAEEELKAEHRLNSDG